MPNHHTHDLIAVTAAPVFTAASLAYLDIPHALIFGAAFLITNHYLSPDTDTRSIIDYRWGMLSWIWYPYRKLFHHRSFFTHSGPISATLRIMYVMLVLSPLLLIIPWYDIVYFVKQYQLTVLIWYIAACLSDTLHTGVDYLVHIAKIPFSFWKKPRRTY